MELPDCPPGAEGYQDTVTEVPKKLEDNSTCTKAEQEFLDHLNSLKIKIEDGNYRCMVERRGRDVSGKWIYLCYPCAAVCSGEAILQTHISGKKHKNKLSMRAVWPLSIFKDHPYNQSEHANKMAATPKILKKMAEEVELFHKSSSEMDLKYGKLKDVQCHIQDTLDEVSTPLMGLEYLVEHPPLESHYEPSYTCTLCYKQGHPRTIVNHMTCFWHRHNYLQRHYPKAADMLKPYRQQIKYREGVSFVMNRIATLIEEKYGRMKPINIDKEDYEREKERIHQWIFKGPHCAETPDCTFEEVVDIDLIHTLYRNPDSQKVGMKDPSPPVVAVPRPINANRAAARRKRRISMESLSDLSDDLECYEPKNIKNNKKPQKAHLETNRSRDLSVPRGKNASAKSVESTKRQTNYEYKLQVANDRRVVVEEAANKSLAYHEKNPEKHPLYPDEWKKFWNQRYKEIQAEGKDPSKHDFKPEWIVYWTSRMKELHREELRLQVVEIYRKMCLTPPPERLSPPPDAKDRKRSPESRRRYQSTFHAGGDTRRRTPELRRRSPPHFRRDRRSPPPHHRRSPPRRHSPVRMMRTRSRSPVRARSPPRTHIVLDSRGGSPLSRREMALRNRSPGPRNRSPVPRIRSPALRNRSPGIRNRSPLPRNRSPGIRIRSPGIRNRSPGIRNRSPVPRTRSPGIRNRSPVPRNRSPVPRNRSPIHRNRSPVIRNRSPPTRNRSPQFSRGDVQRHSSSRNRSPLPTIMNTVLISDDELNPDGDASPWNSTNSLESLSSLPDARSTPPSARARDPPADNVVATLRTLVALEDYLGSLGPRVIDLLAEAIKMEKEKANSSEELLERESAVVLIETAKEKLKGAAQAGLVASSAATAVRAAIVRAAATLHEADKRTRALKAENSKKAAAVPVAGVGAVDRAQIAQEMAVALITQGKTDVSEEELAQLVDAVVGIAEAKKREADEIKKQSTPKPDPSPETQSPVSSGTASALQMLQSAYDDRRNGKDDTPDAMDGLSDSDLETLLKNFNELSAEEQHSLIAYLKKLEAREPQRVERLRQYVSAAAVPAAAPSPAVASAPASVPAFAAVPAASPVDVAPVPIESDDDDYTVEEVFKSATEKVKEDQIRQEMEIVKKSLEESKVTVPEAVTAVSAVSTVSAPTNNLSSAANLLALVQASLQSANKPTQSATPQIADVVTSNTQPRSFGDLPEAYNPIAPVTTSQLTYASHIQNQQFFKPQIGTRPPQIETRSPQIETRPPQIETRPPQIETRPSQIETRPPLIETRPRQLETRSPLIRTRPLQNESRPLQIESRPLQIESRPLQIESRPLQIESRPTQIESRPQKIETRPLQIENRPLQIESRPLQIESRPTQIESRPLQIENRPLQIESRPLQIESRPTQIESRPQKIETRLPLIENRPQQIETRLPLIENRPQQIETRLPLIENRPQQNSTYISSNSYIHKDPRLRGNNRITKIESQLTSNPHMQNERRFGGNSNMHSEPQFGGNNLSTQNDARFGNMRNDQGYGGNNPYSMIETRYSGKNSSMCNEKSFGGSKTPSTYNEQSLGGSKTPSTYNEQPFGGSKTPSTYNEQPFGGSKTPSTYNEQSFGGSKTPSTYNEQPFGGSKTPSTYNEQSFGGSKTPSTYNEQPFGGSKTPSTYNEQPFGGSKTPSTYNEQPFGGSNNTNVHNEQPFGGSKTPNAYNEVPSYNGSTWERRQAQNVYTGPPRDQGYNNYPQNNSYNQGAQDSYNQRSHAGNFNMNSGKMQEKHDSRPQNVNQQQFGNFDQSRGRGGGRGGGKGMYGNRGRGRGKGSW